MVLVFQEGAQSPEGWSYNEFISLMFDLKGENIKLMTVKITTKAIVASIFGNKFLLDISYHLSNYYLFSR